MVTGYELYIEGKLVDMDETNIILIQKQRTDYTNPTIVKNSFTKTIKLPSTKNNDDVFGNIWKLDRNQFGFSSFNPSKRVPFILNKYGTLVNRGYIKLDNILWDSAKQMYFYEITLYGELGNILYSLSYMTDDDENRKLTLGDLDMGFSGFSISIGLIETAWKRLAGDTTMPSIFDTINFCVSYDGIPSAKNFDTKKVWCSVNRTAAVSWRNTKYTYSNFPSSITEDGVTYSAVRTMVSRMDPNDYYGLLELKSDITTNEARDFRSYLLRPVVSVRGVFSAIERYLNTKYGYTLDLSDPFFSTPEFTDTWITLSMLYEIDPDVESYTYFTKEKLFSNTDMPSSYFISYCKIFGLYIDVDFIRKKVVLSRLPNFFNNEVNELDVDRSKNINIVPLSFDKATYTFNYNDGESEFLDNYRGKYGLQYGSKLVNTGYEFDSASTPYITNNIYRQGVDALEQSIYYRYSNSIKASTFICHPQELADDANLPVYKLFNTNDYSDIKTIEGEMMNTYSYSIGAYRFNLSTTGYQFQDDRWGGLQKGVYWDGFPKLQFHSEGNKPTDGKDVLVMFNGFKSTQYGWQNSQSSSYGEDYSYRYTKFVRESMTGYEYVKYLISDDNKYLKDVIGVNCYYDNPIPDVGCGDNYIKQIDSLPSFTRCKYSFGCSSSKYPLIVDKYFGDHTLGTTSSATITGSTDYFLRTQVTASSGRQYPYIEVTGILPGRYYLLVAAVATVSPSTILSGNPYAYPAFVDSYNRVVTYKYLDNDDLPQIVASVIKTDDTSYPTRKFCPLSTNNLSTNCVFLTSAMAIYDITDIYRNDYSIENWIDYFKITPSRVGYSFDTGSSLDFSIPREIYVPNCRVYDSNYIYGRYWANYVKDLYSVNTRIFKCECYLDNIDDSFRNFYIYDNALWQLSKVEDWNDESKLCKASFIKVNDRNNYLT